jgi:hypothetical protein
VRTIFSLLISLVVLNNLYAQENFLSLNLQFHWDILRDHPTVTQEFYATDKLGYTFFFMDVNFDRYRQRGGVSDFYFEIMRYFRLAKFRSYDVYFTVQYDDGSEPIQGVVLAGLNLGNIMIGPFNVSTEFLLKKEYKLDINWQYTLVWYAEFINGKLIFNGFLDYWINDVDNPNWPSFDPELAASRYSFQAEPQLGWLVTPQWKIGSEVEISRGFLGSVTGKLTQEERYKHDKWYFLPTVFIQYNF